MTLRTDTEVTSVDLGQKSVIIGGTGQEKVEYEVLVLATGGIPRRLPIAGKDLSNVYTLRDVEDAKKIDAGGCIRFSAVFSLHPSLLTLRSVKSC